MNSARFNGTYKWQIQDKNIITQITSSTWKDKFESDVFQIGELNWKIRIRPNGWNDKNKGFCCVLVSLLDMPYAWKYVFCQLHIHCPQTQNTMIASYSYNKSKNMNRGSYISSFEDFKASLAHADQLTFIITIHIARITLKDNNKILFQMLTNKYKTNMRCQWNIDEQMMTNLKSFRRPKGICSDIYHDMWCLRLYPNGNMNGKEGRLRVVLHLCAFPPNVSQMIVECNIYCHEANIRQTLTSDFDVEGRSNCTWDDDVISFADFSKHNTWTVLVDINVLNQLDADGEKVTMTEDECKEPQNDTHDITVKQQLEIHGSAIQTLSTTMEQVKNTLDLLSKTVETLSEQIQKLNVEESKEEHIDLKHVMTEISNIKAQMAIANTQHMQKNNRGHEQVRDWLQNDVHLEQYYTLFIDNGFEDLESIKTIDMEILKMMKIEKIGHKMKILRCVAKLNNTVDDAQNEGNTAYL
eukprot:134585_1